MASLSKRTDGRLLIRFTNHQAKRKTISLGTMGKRYSKQDAEWIKLHVEASRHGY